jgi:hypothetical protein
MTDSKFKCNIFLFLSVTVFMARLSRYFFIFSAPMGNEPWTFGF